MKLPFLLTSVVLLALPACEKVRDFREKLGKKPSAAPATRYTGDVVSEIDESGYETFSQLTGRVIIVDFYADRCGLCRKIAPILNDIAAENKGLVLVGKIDVDKFPAFAGKLGVQGIPDVRIFRDGKQVDRFVGMPDEAEVRQKIASYLKGVAPLPVEAPKTDPNKANAPLTQPMTKDWMPEGIKRR